MAIKGISDVVASQWSQYRAKLHAASQLGNNTLWWKRGPELSIHDIQPRYYGYGNYFTSGSRASSFKGFFTGETVLDAQFKKYLQGLRDYEPPIDDEVSSLKTSTDGIWWLVQFVTDRDTKYFNEVVAPIERYFRDYRDKVKNPKKSEAKKSLKAAGLYPVYWKLKNIDSKIIYKKRKPYNYAVYDMLLSGADFLGQHFNVVFYFYGQDDDFATKNFYKPEVLLSRFSSVEVPQSKARTFTLKTAIGQVDKIASKFEMVQEATLKVRLDEDLTLFDKIQQIGYNTLAEEKPYSGLHLIENLRHKNVRLDILVFQTDTLFANANYKGQDFPDEGQVYEGMLLDNKFRQMFWVFEDVNILGAQNAIEFDRDGGNALEMPFKFVYKRSYLYRMSAKGLTTTSNSTLDNNDNEAPSEDDGVSENGLTFSPTFGQQPLSLSLTGFSMLL